MVFNKKQTDYMLSIVSMFSDNTLPAYIINEETNLPPHALLPNPGAKFMIRWEGAKFEQDWHITVSECLCVPY
ncbi:hypothetical protein OUZ56_004066 [Daphnia magna]|uniref:Uncharacterized protein n=1 Tax=Daphnia magna TaxID=35525 RepID=A0ABQ9YNM5_9CRUS|nr:hypothetical protein OUZ56_004066 [Daphnia magna]